MTTQAQIKTIFLNLFLFWILGLLAGCSSDSNHSDTQKNHHVFNSDNHVLDAQLTRPSGHSDSNPIILFVHGDGAMDHSSKGYYGPIIDALAEKKIASFSWSKAGVGQSKQTRQPL
ncbi:MULTISPECIES: alpha/beta hydrolase family protein [unclassified Pseudoalteromonas]|uniref:alpha/beta hydrolase family protein n=1 Tax=unclassified Pseudoalteromonas TaxID=194690 RepID=UPI0038685B6C